MLTSIDREARSFTAVRQMQTFYSPVVLPLVALANQQL